MSCINVSVIIPTYNGADTILVAVNSVLQQTIKDIEIIIVDDNEKNTHGQEETKRKLEAYINENKVQYICHGVNRGGSVARNTGARLSKGKYLIFLDDDDVLLPNMIEENIKKLQTTNESVGVSVCGGYYVKCNGVGYCRKLTDNSNMIRDYLLDKQYFNTSAIFVKREAFESIGGFDESFIRHQDWEFCVRLFSMYEVEIIDKPLIIRYVTGKRGPQNFDQKECYLDYFFEKMSDLLKHELSVKEYQCVRNYKYSEIAVQHYLELNFLKGMKFMIRKKCKLGGIMCSVKVMLKRISNKLIKGRKKISYTQDEICAKYGIIQI